MNVVEGQCIGVKGIVPNDAARWKIEVVMDEAAPPGFYCQPAEAQQSEWVILGEQRGANSDECSSGWISSKN